MNLNTISLPTGQQKHLKTGEGPVALPFSYGAFTIDVKSMLNENLGGILHGILCGILGGNQC